MDSLPLFPKFKKLEISDKKTVMSFTQKFGGHSDFNFASLYSYDTNNDLTISNLNDNLVILFKSFFSKPFYSFMGKNALRKTAETLLGKAKTEKTLKELKDIPEEIATNKSIADNFLVSEDRANFDYILSVDEISTLAGSRFANQRKLISRFAKAYPKHSFRQLALSDKKTYQDILSIFSVWEKAKKRPKEDTIHELHAIKRILQHQKVLDIIIYGVYIENLIIGFIILDTERKGMSESHFLKADPKFPGLTHLLHNYAAQELQKKHYEFINIEQDLGIPGIRYTKEQCRPVRYLKRYSVSLK